ncbi:MAG: hypothetical protein AB7G87_03950 [Clostridia bacterium]
MQTNLQRRRVGRPTLEEAEARRKNKIPCPEVGKVIQITLKSVAGNTKRETYVGKVTDDYPAFIIVQAKNKQRECFSKTDIAIGRYLINYL